VNVLLKAKDTVGSDLHYEFVCGMVNFDEAG
jgi:hypothetical protein